MAAAAGGIIAAAMAWTDCAADVATNERRKKENDPRRRDRFRIQRRSQRWRVPATAASQRSAKNEESAGRHQHKADGVIPGDRLLEIENGESRKHQQGDDFLDGFELGGRVDRAA
jgi:hypothetical protein